MASCLEETKEQKYFRTTVQIGEGLLCYFQVRVWICCLQEILFHRGTEREENPVLKDLPAYSGIWLSGVYYRPMQKVFKYSCTLLLNTHSHLAPRLRKSRAIPLFPLWAFMVCWRVNFTFVNLPVNRDFRIIHLQIKHFWLYGLSCSSYRPPSNSHLF